MRIDRLIFLSVLALLCLNLTVLHAQKRVVRQVLDPEVESILIEGQQCFRILLETAKTDEVRVSAEMQGEYQDALLIQTERLGNTLRISTGFAPDFDLPNDKLGAHKVFSVSLRVVLPENQRLRLFAGNSEVHSSGTFRTLEARLDSGLIEIGHIADRTEIQTRTAEIKAHITSGLVQADSRHGEVSVAEIPGGDPIYLLKSSSGDIEVALRP